MQSRQNTEGPNSSITTTEAVTQLPTQVDCEFSVNEQTQTTVVSQRVDEYEPIQLKWMNTPDRHPFAGLRNKHLEYCRTSAEPDDPLFINIDHIIPLRMEMPKGNRNQKQQYRIHTV